MAVDLRKHEMKQAEGIQNALFKGDEIGLFFPPPNRLAAIRISSTRFMHEHEMKQAELWHPFIFLICISPQMIHKSCMDCRVEYVKRNFQRLLESFSSSPGIFRKRKIPICTILHSNSKAIIFKAMLWICFQFPSIRLQATHRDMRAKKKNYFSKMRHVSCRLVLLHASKPSRSVVLLTTATSIPVKYPPSMGHFFLYCWEEQNLK